MVMTCHSAAGISDCGTNSISTVRSDRWLGSDTSTVNRRVRGTFGLGAAIRAALVKASLSHATSRSRGVIDVPRLVGNDGLGVALGRQLVDAAEQVLEPVVRVAGGVLARLGFHLPLLVALVLVLPNEPLVQHRAFFLVDDQRRRPVNQGCQQAAHCTLPALGRAFAGEHREPRPAHDLERRLAVDLVLVATGWIAVDLDLAEWHAELGQPRLELV